MERKEAFYFLVLLQMDLGGKRQHERVAGIPVSSRLPLGKEEARVFREEVGALGELLDQKRGVAEVTLRGLWNKGVGGELGKESQ